MKSELLVVALLLMTSCRERSQATAAIASGAGGVCGGDGIELFGEEFTAKELPETESRSFGGFPGQTSGTLCVTAKNVITGSVTVNGVEEIGPLEFNGAAEQTLTADFTLESTNALSVLIAGVACPPPPDVECASIHIRARALPPGPLATPPILAQEVAPVSACCNDVTCDKVAFAASGGVCAGDPRIRGPLAVDAPAAH